MAQDLEKTSTILEIEEEIGQDLIEYIEKRRLEGADYSEISDEIHQLTDGEAHPSYRTVSRWLDKYGEEPEEEEIWEQVKREMGEFAREYFEKNSTLPGYVKLEEEEKWTYISAMKQRDETPREIYAEFFGFPEDWKMSMMAVSLEIGEPVDRYLSRGLKNGQTRMELAEELPVTYSAVKSWVRELVPENHRNSRRPRGYLEDQENVKNDLKPVLEEFYEEKGRPPTFSELADIDRGLVYGIREHHGGREKYPVFVEDLGYEPDEIPFRRNPGYWPEEENVKKELDPLVEEYLNEHGQLPTFSWLRHLHSNLRNALRDHHNGKESYHRFLRELGYDLEKIESNRREPGLLEDEGNFLDELEPILEQEFEERNSLPSLNRLGEIDSGLRRALYKYYKGMESYKEFVEKLGYNHFHIETVQIEDGEDVVHLMEEDQVLSKLFKAVSGDEAYLRDAIYVKYGENVSYKTIKETLGRRKANRLKMKNREPGGDEASLIEAGAQLIPMDRDGIIRTILKTEILKKRRQKIGADADLEDLNRYRDLLAREKQEGFRRELEDEVGDEEIQILEELYDWIIEDTEEMIEWKESGIEGIVDEIKVPGGEEVVGD